MRETYFVSKEPIIKCESIDEATSIIEDKLGIKVYKEGSACHWFWAVADRKLELLHYIVAEAWMNSKGKWCLRIATDSESGKLV